MKYIMLLALVVQSAMAYPIYFYNNEQDLQRNVAFAEANTYDGYDVDDATDIGKYDCFSLDDYNYYASLDGSDGRERLTARTINRDEFNHLRYSDQLRIINENPGDKWDEGDIDDYGDMGCWNLKDYNMFAAERSGDRWDEIHFRDSDDVREINRIGIRRFGFVDADDVSELDVRGRRQASPRYEGYGYYG